MPIYAGGFLALFLFSVAKDWHWLESWAYTLAFVVIMGVGYAIINRNRAKLKKEGLTAATLKCAGSDRFILPVTILGFFGA